MVVTLYHDALSPASRIVLLTARAIGVGVDVRLVDLVKQEHMKPEFLKLNPQHTVPVMQDDELILCESRAIAAYLVGRYAKDDSLYPKDLKKRALVDQRLYFDATMLFPRIRQICFPIIFLGSKSITDECKAAVHESLGYLDIFLKGNQWVAGDNLTIADLACVTTVSTIVEVGLDISEHKNVKRWLSKCECEIPNYKEVNKDGAIQLGKAVRSKLASA